MTAAGPCFISIILSLPQGRVGVSTHLTVTRAAPVSLGFVLAVVTFGHLLHEPLYESHTHVIPPARAVVILLLPREDDRLSPDHLLRTRD